MPHATLQRSAAEDEEDDILIGRVLNPGDPNDLENGLDLQRDLEPGEKAEDAVDFGDLSDGDLADDDDDYGHGDMHDAQDLRHTHPVHQGNAAHDLGDFMEEENLPAMTHEDNLEDDGIDDLFADNPSSPMDGHEGVLHIDKGLADPDGIFGDDSEPPHTHSTLHSMDHVGNLSESSNLPAFHHDIFEVKDAPLSREQQIQMELFEMSKLGQDTLPAPPENQEELLASLWPKFKRNTVPKFIELLPPKKARYVGKAITRPSKPLIPTKLSLDLAPDQEKSFKAWPTSNKRNYEADEQPTVVIIEPECVDDSTADERYDIDSDDDNEDVGGVSWQDLQIACGDWEIPSSPGSEKADHEGQESYEVRSSGEKERDAEYGLEIPAAKRQRVDHSVAGILRTPQFPCPSFHDPETSTARIAKTVTLDLNDPHLLFDHVQHSAPSRSVFGRSDLKKAGHGAFAKGLSQRYNISNDEAYDLLKENHQSKVRSMLGNVPVEHSLPATRLQWPFYKTRLDKQDARAFHRPSFNVNRNENVSFGKPKFLKRKHLKGKGTQSLFQDSNDLTLGDNSNVLLLEYSEEYPTMLSNVGMGSRVINYYRRKTMEDTSRPKIDIGETAVLLPQDKSPFSVFGHVDAGQAMPALYNSMYRAPIFKQAAKATDFLIVKTNTGVEGSTWFLRNIENLYAVGQEFPFVDVPGPHSRKVTTAAKNRLKMISYRLVRKNKAHRISVGAITSHFADTSDMQNRQKMKEFMQFNKEHKEWQMRQGEAVPDEETVRTMVRPEDVCLLESMQVGQQHLQDAGFSKEDDDSELDEAKEGQSIEQQLAPWYTSRNFLHATQGKAMLALHGEGDPSGRGEAFSFIKTSMKGGFRAAEASATEKMRAKQMKDSNGHAYNVQEQQKSYEQSIRRIWETQKQSLSSNHEQTDLDMDDDPVEKATSHSLRAGTPRSEAQTSTTLRRRDDESASQYTQHSTGSHVERTLEITRNFRDENGQLVPRTEVVRDPRVIRQYFKQKNQKEEALLARLPDLVKPTGDPHIDKRNQRILQKEHTRLMRNKERRLAREKGKVHFDGAADDADSPSSPAQGVAKAAGTQRKCANCGQVGHIKTNKKLCPMLNGTMKPEEGFNNSAFTMGPSVT